MNIDLTIEEIETIKECLTETIKNTDIKNVEKILKIDDLYNKLEKESEV